VRALRYYDPTIVIDAIDLDPMMLDIADEYFGTRETESGD